MSRRRLYLLALAILVGGLALALLVVPARTCGMDQFDCFASENAPKALVAIGAAVVALVVAVIGMFRA